MFFVFGWKGVPQGGGHDLLKVFVNQDAAMLFVDSLLHTDSAWEVQLTNDCMEILFESAEDYTPMEYEPLQLN